MTCGFHAAIDFRYHSSIVATCIELYTHQRKPMRPSSLAAIYGICMNGNHCNGLFGCMEPHTGFHRESLCCRALFKFYLGGAAGCRDLLKNSGRLFEDPRYRTTCGAGRDTNRKLMGLGVCAPIMLRDWKGRTLAEFQAQCDQVGRWVQKATHVT